MTGIRPAGGGSMLNFTDSDNDDILNQQSYSSERMKSNKCFIYMVRVCHIIVF